MKSFTLPTLASRRLALLFGGMVLAAVAAVVVARNPARAAAPEQAAAQARPVLSVSTVQPVRAELAVTLPANGSIAAWQEASIGSETNGWRLAEVRVNVGDSVRRGQVLARFAVSMAEAELAQSRAAVAEAEAATAEAAANAQRARELQTSGALSAQLITQYLTAERTAQARLEAARATLQVQQLRLAQTQVLAPDDGVISSRSATLGAVVPAGTELFRLIRQGRLEWRAEVPAQELARIKPGQAVRVMAGGNGGGAVLPGRVRMIGPTVDPATRVGLVYVDLIGPDRSSSAGGPGESGSNGAAKAGMFARGDFVLGSASALTLPQSAVLLREGQHLVFAVGADGRVQQLKVEVGRRVADRIEISAGLDANARVVQSGGAFLADGDRVTVVPAGTPAPSASGPAAARAPASLAPTGQGQTAKAPAPATPPSR